MFFEEINMLLPVETFHDEATNTVYTTTDRMGTYCLMDVEIWLSNLGIEPEIPEVSEALVSEKAELASFTSNSVYTSAKRELAAANTVSKSYRDYFDVAFLIDSRISDDEKFVEIKKSILDVCDMIFNVSPNARVRFIQLMSVERKDVNFYQAITDENGNEFCTDYGAVNDALAKIEQEESGKVNIFGLEFGTYDSCNVCPGLMEVLASEPMGKYAYCFYILEKEQSLYNTGDVDLAVGENIAPTISVSVISDYIPPSDGEAENYAYIPTLCKNTNGFIASYDETYESCLTEIYGEVPVLENAYKAIIATGYQTIVLDAPITESYETAYKFVEQNPNSSAFYGSYADTDKDGLKDFQEILYDYVHTDFSDNVIVDDLITWDGNGNVILPTYETVELLMNDLPYVEKGLERYCSATGENANNYIVSLEGKRILPIISDPTSEDGDGDKLLDLYSIGIKNSDCYPYSDPNPLKSDINEILLKNDFFSVDYEYRNAEGALSNWATARNNGKYTSYGGYQGWFGSYGYTKDSLLFCNGKTNGGTIHSDGCGIIAVADMFMYMAISDHKYIPISQSEIITELGTTYEHIKFDRYVSYIEHLSDYFKIYRFPLNGIPAIFPSSSLLKSLKSINESNQMNLNFIWNLEINKESTIIKIKEMLSKDIPVICSYNDNNKLTFYRKNGMNFSKEQDTIFYPTSHYMVITGVYEYSDELKDLLGHSSMLKIATYGQEFYADYDEYSQKLSVDTNILLVEKVY